MPGTALQLLIEAAVLVDSTDLGAKRPKQSFVLLAESIGTHLVGKADPAVGMRQRHHRYREEGTRPRVAGRQTGVDGSAVVARDPPCLARRQDAAQRAGLQARACGPARGDIESAYREERLAVAVLAARCEHRVLRAEQAPRSVANVLQQRFRVALGGELHVQVGERGKARVGGLQFGRALPQLVGQQPEVLGIELARNALGLFHRRAREDLVDGLQHAGRLAGLDQHLRDPAARG